MIYRRIGSLDISVSIVGLGTVKFGRNTNVKYPKSFALPSEQEITHLLSHCQTEGINFLDTAPAYGNSEQLIGKCLPGLRSDWVIMSKAGEYYENEQSNFRYDSQSINSSVISSLKNLQTDYLDMVLIHSNGDDVDIIERYEVFNTMQRLKDKGYIRGYGMSTKTIEGGLLAAKHADAVMVSYNLQDTQGKAVIDYAHEHNKGVFIKKALSSGHLDKAVENPVQQAFDHVASQPGISTVIIGSINPNHISDNIRYAKRAFNI